MGPFNLDGIHLRGNRCTRRTVDMRAVPDVAPENRQHGKIHEILLQIKPSTTPIRQVRRDT